MKITLHLTTDDTIYLYVFAKSIDDHFYFSSNYKEKEDKIIRQSVCFFLILKRVGKSFEKLPLERSYYSKFATINRHR